MGFPYLAPLKPWIKNILEEREKSRNLKNLSSPFIVLTSGAKVIKTTPESDADERFNKLKSIIENNTDAKYYGCIITNTSGSTNLYEQKETSLGYDFKGKKIVVEGETNRRVSPPIIEGLDIDTDGANNTLKTAKLTIKCFTLKQLEMFEIFFLKPGMNLLVEYGDNSLDRRKGVAEVKEPEKIPIFDRIQRSGKIADGNYFNRIEDALINKKDYLTFVQDFSSYYRATTDSLSQHLGKIEKTLGTYDLVAGKVTDFSFEVDENGVYTVNLEISQGNQMTLAIPLIEKKGQNSNKKGKLKDVTPDYEQNLELISTDFNLPLLKEPMAPKNYWENHLFNFGKLNQTQSDTSRSNKPYISLHFIFEILMNYIIDTNLTIDLKTFRFDIPTYFKDKDKKQEIKCIPIFYHKNIISSNEDVIFPNATLPKIIATEKSTKITIDGSKPIDGSIGSGTSAIQLRLKDNNNKDIDELFMSDNTKISPPSATNKDILLGNAANIFVNYIKVVEMWRKSGTRKEFLFKLLAMINDAGYGFYTLVYGNLSDGTLGEKGTIRDDRGGCFGMDAQKSIYRFKPGTINSNVRNFSFNFELSNLVAGRTVFNAQSVLMNAAKKKGANDNSLPLDKEAYKSVDFSMNANADGYYSINQIDFYAINDTWKDLQSKTTGTINTDEEKKDNETPNLAEIIKSNSTSFKTKDTSIIYIYKDEAFIREQLHKEIKPKSTLSPIDVTIEIDGLSGLSCGEYFEIDGVPEIYNQTGVFQITNTKHNISSDGWKTTIEAGYRIIKKGV